MKWYFRGDSAGDIISRLPHNTDLSNNMLEGRIPESPHFSTFDNSSFMGNAGLCGPPLSKQCSNETPPNSALHNSEEKSVDVMLFLFVGLGFGVGFAVAIVVIWVSPLENVMNDHL